MSASSTAWSGASTFRSARRALVTLALATVLGALVASPAAAHSALISSDPADGDTLTTAPESLLLTFNEDILEMGTSIQVTGPEGTDVSDGDPELDGPEVRQSLVSELPAGEYVVIWRVVSADGHPIDGELTFTAEEGLGVTGAEGEAGGESEPAEDGSAEAESEALNEDPTEEITEGADENAAADSTSGAAAGTDETADAGASAADDSEGPSAGRIALFAVIALGVIGAVVAAVVRLRRAS